MYGKMQDGVLAYAPKTLISEGKKIINPTEAMLLEHGYKPITYTPCPQDDQHYRQEAVETEEEIQFLWVDNEAQYWTAIPYDEAVNAEIRKRYSESQEFAILRQKEEKQSEYAEYFDYCEQCKERIKAKKAEYGQK